MSESAGLILVLLSAAKSKYGIERKLFPAEGGDAMAKATKKKASGPDELKGWQQIAGFLGQPISVAQRWAESGMPVEKRGRYVYSSRAELNRWLGREAAGEPVQIATKETDLGTELKRGLAFLRKQSKHHNSKRAA
jgi:hypothetical protein